MPNIHIYHRPTREYLRTEGWTRPEPWVALPSYAVAADAAPLPPARAGHARVLNAQGDAWEYAEDHRGKAGWLADGTPHVVDTLGPLPDGWSETEPHPSLEEARTAKAREIRAGYDTALAGVLAGAEATATGVAVGSALMAVTDSEGLEYLVERLQVNAGDVEDPTFHATIYAAPDDANPWDEATWHACNPALGDFRSLEEMRTFAEQAQRIPAREAVFRNLYLNQRIDAEVRFISASDWNACAGQVDLQSLYGHPCWVGLDLSSTRDLTALVCFFPEDGGSVLPFFFVPGDRLDEREDQDRVPYRTWRDRGHIEAFRGRAIDKTAVARRLATILADFDVRGVAYDRWRMEDLKRILDDEGIRVPLVGFGQGFKDMAPAIDALEAAVLDRRIQHGGHPVLRWNCSNCVVDTDPAGNRKLSKKRSRERIDGMVALAMAVGLWAREQKPPEIILDPDAILVLTA
jgi:hypothetical protein